MGQTKNNWIEWQEQQNEGQDTSFEKYVQEKSE
jgi:hypothetical protein